MNVNWQFNAQQHEPNQGFGIHPPALKIPFQITNTSIKETKDKTGGYLSVEITTPQGMVTSNYNINNQSPKAVEVAYGQLSALCRAVGVFQIDGQNECAALRGAKGLCDIGYQRGEEPDPAFPDRKGYTELKRVYDINGNDPSKPNAAQGAQQSGGFGGGQQPAQNQPAGGPTPMNAGGGSWGGAQPNPAQQQPQGQQQPTQPQGQAWQPGGAATGAAPPWGQR